MDDKTRNELELLQQHLTELEDRLRVVETRTEANRQWQMNQNKK